MSKAHARLLFSMNLYDYMAAKSVSMADLCRNTGIPYTTLANWLQAKRYPRPEHLNILSKYLGVSKADLT